MHKEGTAIDDDVVTKIADDRRDKLLASHKKVLQSAGQTQLRVKRDLKRLEANNWIIPEKTTHKTPAKEPAQTKKISKQKAAK